MKTNTNPVSTADRDWSDLKVLVKRYLDETGPDGATDVMHLVSEWLNNTAIDLPEGDDTEETYNDYAAAVDVIEACMAGMDLKYGLENYKTAYQQRQEALSRFKFFANKLRA